MTHNYERNHQYNLWFTIAVPPTSDLEAVVQRIHELARAEVTRVMYTLRLFKIGVNLDMTGQRPPDAISTPEYREQDRVRARDFTVTELDKTVIRELQEDLPIEPRPFNALAERIGLSEDGLFAAMHSLVERGFMRRMAAILYHRRAGFRANGMGVWAVPEDDVVEIGEADGVVRERQPLLPSTDLSGLAVQRLHDGPRHVSGAVRGDPVGDLAQDRRDRVHQPLQYPRV